MARRSAAGGDRAVFDSQPGGAPLDYARRLQGEMMRFEKDLLIVMRVYLKPRTTIGWKGLINDPRLDNSFRINEGVRLARRLL